MHEHESRVAARSSKGRGRTSNPAIDKAILEATIALLATEGYDLMSMDRVAAKAGVSKATVYHRYASKQKLVGAGLAYLRTEHDPNLPGSLRDDLIQLLKEMRRQYREGGGMGIIGTCLATQPRSEELLETVRRSTLLPRREYFADAFRAAQQRGELSEDLAIDRCVSLVVGALYADHLAGIPMDEGWEEEVIDYSLRGILKR